MVDAAKKIGLRPSFGASPFALGRGEQFERSLLADNAARLLPELRRAGLIRADQSDLLDLRITSNGGTNHSLSTLDHAIEESLTFLETAGRARNESVVELSALTAAVTVRIPRGVMLPEALLIIDAVTITPVDIEGGTRALLSVGEIKTYPDRGGETNRGQLAQARAQLGLYLHALEVICETLPLAERPLLSEDGFLVLTRPGSDFPSVRRGEKLRYQAERAARGFDQLEEIALTLEKSPVDPIQAVLDAETHYCEACLEFCDLATRCHEAALREQNPAVLGDGMVNFLGNISLKRASELLEGIPPLDTREIEMVERLRAAEEPGWE